MKTQKQKQNRERLAQFGECRSIFKCRLYLIVYLIPSYVNICLFPTFYDPHLPVNAMLRGLGIMACYSWKYLLFCRKESKILLKPIDCLMKDYHNTSWAIHREACSMSELALTKNIKEDLIWSLTTVYYLVFFRGKKDNYCPYLYVCSASHAENI